MMSRGEHALVVAARVFQAGVVEDKLFSGAIADDAGDNCDDAHALWIMYRLGSARTSLYQSRSRSRCPKRCQDWHSRAALRNTLITGWQHSRPAGPLQ